MARCRWPAVLRVSGDEPSTWNYSVQHDLMTDYPWQSVGLLRFNDYNNNECQASAFVAGLSIVPFNPRNAVVTAAHCLVEYDSASSALPKIRQSTNIKFYPAAHIDNNRQEFYPYGSFKQLPGGLGTAYFVHPAYLAHCSNYDERVNYDIAVILLENNANLFNLVEPLPVLTFHTWEDCWKQLTAKPLMRLGFPKDKPSGDLYQEMMHATHGYISYTVSGTSHSDGRTILMSGGANYGCSGGPWLLLSMNGMVDSYEVIGITTRNCSIDDETSYSISPLFRTGQLFYELICSVVNGYDESQLAIII